MAKIVSHRVADKDDPIYKDGNWHAALLSSELTRRLPAATQFHKDLLVKKFEENDPIISNAVRTEEGWQGIVAAIGMSLNNTAYILDAEQVDDNLIEKARSGKVIEAYLDARFLSPEQLVIEAEYARQKFDELQMLLDPIVVGPIAGSDFELIEKLAAKKIRTTGKTYQHYVESMRQKREDE